MTDAQIPDDASRAQIAAADPSGSVWLAANAGAGKTRVLTDRVAWLLLEGTPPERILCLTYTRAAAGEMQNRLYARLGNWAMMPDPDLRGELEALGVPTLRISSERLRHARTLFARAIETPGGLKIQTIHAFCASLLRRFPLEAGVSPAFLEMDETATTRLHVEILDEMASGPDAPLVDAMAARLSDSEPSVFLAAVAKAWPPGTKPLDEDALRAGLGITDENPEGVRNGAVTADDVTLIETVRDAAISDGGKKMVDLTRILSQAIVADHPERFDLLSEAFLKKDLDPLKSPVSKSVTEAIGDATVEAVYDLAARLSDAHAYIAAFVSLDYARALHAFAPAFVARLEAAKQARGWLDFDDQIARARALLSTSDMAQWVLFRLDGGLDHMLVDEAQDTAPAQWDVIAALVAEFGGGSGARPDVARTLFVVGDQKQSIYSFQGADPDAFAHMRDVFARTLGPGLPYLRDHALRHSFRSSPAILDLVDAVFAEGGGVGPAPVHIAHRADMPGRVDLWAPIEQEKEDHSDRKWHDPVDREARNDAEILLAERIADAIVTMLRDGTPITHKGVRRAVEPKDILILLQRRGPLFHHVIRACKKRDLDLAGADRLKLSDDLAVRDLIALLTWAATPDDDLSLACVLRSPLGGVDEAGLFDLSHGRKSRPLWSVLRDSGRDVSMLADILRVADILRPYEILQRVLIRNDARRRLLARLGAEADEAIEALLGQALAYERLEVPSLAGFLGWLSSADVDLKRQGGRGSIRVMSVHGAKGLESPVVILPDTRVRPPKAPSGVRRLPNGIPIWMPAKAGWSPAVKSMAQSFAEAQAAERDRLLYVALTRAESWLIVAAAGDVGAAPKDSWWRQVEAGMQACGAVPVSDGLRLEVGDWAAMKGASQKGTGPAFLPLPDWIAMKAEAPGVTDRPVAPSDLPGAKILPGEGDGDGETARRRGIAIHRLLEHLPTLLPGERTAAARALLADDDVTAEVLALLDDPALAHVFGTDALVEVPFLLPRGPEHPAVAGTIDRLILRSGRVMIVDFKSNLAVPADAADTPVGLLAQMGAYRAAIRAIWPDRPVDQAILWTRNGRLMSLPDELITGAWEAAARH